MAGKTVSREHLYESARQEVGLSAHDCKVVVEQVLDCITSCVIRGETVKLSGFGLFSVRHKSERVGRNPKTGKKYPISARRVVSFRPSTVLKEKLNSTASSSPRRPSLARGRHNRLTLNLLKRLNDGDVSKTACFNWAALEQRRMVLMRNDFTADDTRERYVVEVDGQAKAECRTFVKAVAAGLQLRQEFPNSHVKLRDVVNETAH